MKYSRLVFNSKDKAWFRWMSWKDGGWFKEIDWHPCCMGSSISWISLLAISVVYSFEVCTKSGRRKEIAFLSMLNDLPSNINSEKSFIRSIFQHQVNKYQNRTETIVSSSQLSEYTAAIFKRETFLQI